MFSLIKPLATLCAVSMFLVSPVAIGNAVQEQKKTQLEGVWKVTEVVPPASNANEKPASITSPQPGLTIFTKGYYSGMAVTGNQPRTAATPAKDRQNLTDAEKIARYEQWRPFTANAGTYELKGTTLTMRPMVAKNPDVMAPEFTITWEIKTEGANAFWLIPPANRATTSARVKFTRLE